MPVGCTHVISSFPSRVLSSWRISTRKWLIPGERLAGHSMTALVWVMWLTCTSFGSFRSALHSGVMAGKGSTSVVSADSAGGVVSGEKTLKGAPKGELLATPVEG